MTPRNINTFIVMLNRPNMEQTFFSFYSDRQPSERPNQKYVILKVSDGEVNEEIPRETD